MLPASILPQGMIGILLKVSTAVWHEYKTEQQEQAERILLSQISRGKPWRLTDKKSAAALFTYLRAAQEGVARRNLELMAEALVASADEATFAPDEFRRHATRLADLSREEILIAAELISCRRDQRPVSTAAQQTADDWDGAKIIRLDPEAEEAQRDGQIWQRVQENLLAKPSIFPNQKLLHGYAGALTRTGWISYIGGWDDGMFRATPLLDVIERLVEWPAAAERAEQNRSDDD